MRFVVVRRSGRPNTRQGGQMRASKAIVRSWLPVIVAFFLGASMVGISWAATTSFSGTVKAKNFKYASPKTVHLVIGAAAFTPNRHGCSFDFEGDHHLPDFGPGGVSSAQVGLPQKATVTKVEWTLANGSGSVLTLNAWTPGLIPSGTVLANIPSTCSGACVLTDSTITQAGGANPVN